LTKPVINSFGMLAPLLIQKYERYLPTAFDESMSILQKMNKIIKRLGELEEISADLIVQWNTVMEWVLNDGLDESVIARLNTMLADGTFDTLINVTILGSKASIVVSAVEPLTSDDTTYWYEDKGEPPINFNTDSNVIVSNVIVSDDEPTNTPVNQLWFDIE
jgi:hypothetical protein